MLKQAGLVSSVVLIVFAGQMALAGPVLDIDPDLMGIPPGGIVVDQPPGQGFGFSSDTSFRDGFGNEIWQLEADNILLSQGVTVGGVSFWGFYGGDDQNHDPPDDDEIIRLRFYASRSDGLPDGTGILLEQYFLNLERVATGRTIAVQGRPREYFFEAELNNPISLSAGEVYWFEVSQVGNLNSNFRWETGSGQLPGHAVSNAFLSDWGFSTGSFAFQLIAVPEPNTTLFLSLGILLSIGRARVPRRSRARQAR